MSIGCGRAASGEDESATEDGAAAEVGDDEVWATAGDDASATEDGAVVAVSDEAADDDWSASEDCGRDADGEEEVDDDEVWAVVDDEASATEDDGMAAVGDEASATEDGAVAEVGDDDEGDGADGESWVDDETTARVEAGSETEVAGRKKKPIPAMPTQSIGITATEMSATRRRTALLATVPDTAAQPSVDSVGIGMPSYASLKACCHLSV